MEIVVQDNEIIDDRYKVISKIGAGGMAIVYKAKDLVLDQVVAIKMIKKDEDIANKEALSRFEREARSAAAVSHKNLVGVLNVGYHKNMPYIVLEYVDGRNLKEVLRIRGKFSFPEALDIMYQLCLAVSCIHKHDIIHRDIKPENIFLTVDGGIKLGDFGIATFAFSPHITMAHNIVGTLEYLAPENCGTGEVTVRSDIYSMGVTFFELITGYVPYSSTNPNDLIYMQTNAKFPSIKKYNSKTPDCIEKIIYKACEKNPNNRYSDVDSMRKDIERIIKNPSLMEKKTRSFFGFFKRDPFAKEAKQEKKAQKKLLKEAAKNKSKK